jgi:hypothetical protein
MQNYFDSRKFSNRETIRRHPWLHSEDNPDEKYVDFKENPDAIPEVLKRCDEWATYVGVQRWYELIRWLNSSDSRLESNDSRFYGPHENDQKEEWPKELVCTGGVMFFFRNLDLNISPQTALWAKAISLGHSMIPQPSDNIGWLVGASSRYLQATRPDFRWGCISISLFSTFYSEAQGQEQHKLGHEVAYEYWAWGDTEEETMLNHEIVVTTMFECLRSLSDEVKAVSG